MEQDPPGDPDPSDVILIMKSEVMIIVFFLTDPLQNLCRRDVKY